MKYLKRILPLLLVLTLLCACSGQEKQQENDIAESYRSVAQGFLDEGDTASACKALEEGIERTGDEGLKQMLAALSAEPEQTSTPTTEPTTEATTKPTTEPTTEATTEPTTEATTEPTTEAPAEVDNGRNITWELSADDWYRINIFLSNFSEQGFATYTSYDAYAMVHFAYLHNKINKPDNVRYDSGSYCFTISGDTVDQTLYRFFGETAEHANLSKTYSGGYTETIEYHDGAYYFPAASGEFYGYISVATSVYRNGDGTYLVGFDVYALDMDTYNNYGISSDYYYLTATTVPSRNDLSYCYSGVALVSDYNGGNYTSYQLLSYETFH